MAEHEKASHKNQDGVEQKHRHGQKESQPLSDYFHVWDEGYITIGETPFQPQIEKHTELLTMARSDEQRAGITLQLQQNYGNKYVQRLIESMKVQAKMTVNPSDDVYEQEADRVTDTVINSAPSHIRRKEEEEEEQEVMPTRTIVQHQKVEEEQEEIVQAKRSENKPQMVSEDLESQINMARGCGHSLSDSLRAFLEPQFGHDFSDVKVHTDAQADKLSRQLGAEAFTTGRDVFFKDGAYQPGSDGGKGLIAHELTHVVQQSQGSLSLSGGKVGKKQSSVAVSDQPIGGPRDVVQRAEELSWGERAAKWGFEKALAIAGVPKNVVMGLISKGRRTLMTIIDEPGRFINTLIKAVGQGFRQFADNIGKHLKAGLFSWLFGSMRKAGIQLPESFSPKAILQLVLQVLGITVEKIREKVVKHIGEKNVRRIEKAWEIISTFMKEGIGGLWEMLKDYLADLKDTVIEGIKSWLITAVIKAAVLKVISMFNPVSGLINIIMMIYNVVKFLIEKARQIAGLFKAIAGSVVELAMGNIGKAANKIEQALARLIPIVIGFLANLLGIGGITNKIREIIKKVQTKVDKALDKGIGKVARIVKKVIGKGKEGFAATRAGALYGRGKAKTKELYGRGKEAYEAGKAKAEEAFERGKAKAGAAFERAAAGAGLVKGKEPSREERWKTGVTGVKKDLAKMEKRNTSPGKIKAQLPKWERKYGFKSLILDVKQTPWVIKGEMSPAEKVTDVPEAEAAAFKAKPGPVTLYRGTIYSCRYGFTGVPEKHDFGMGMYMTYDPKMASEYASQRSAESRDPKDPSKWEVGVVFFIELTLDELGKRRFDFSKGRLLEEWNQYCKTLPLGRPKAGEYYYQVFTNWLATKGLKEDDFDVIIGPEHRLQGIQICVKNYNTAKQLVDTKFKRRVWDVKTVV